MSLDDLTRQGADIDSLARLAIDNPGKLKENLKALGVATLGARTRITTALRAHHEASRKAAGDATVASTELPIASAGSGLASNLTVASTAMPTEPAAKASASNFPSKKKILNTMVGYKERGNVSFKEQNMLAACEDYRRGIEAAASLSAEDADEAQQILLSLHSNMAAAYIALQQWRSANESASAALAIDPDNVKALLRRGACLLRLESHEASKADFLRAAKLEPNNKEAREGLKIIQVLIAHHNKPDWSRGFGAFGTKAASYEEANRGRSKHEAEAAAAAAKAASRPKRTPQAGAPIFGAGLYASDDDDDDGPRIEDVTPEEEVVKTEAAEVADAAKCAAAVHRTSVVVVDDEADLSDAKGYRTRPDGTQTPYFDRGAAPPPPPPTALPATRPASPMQINRNGRAAGPKTSAWNAAGTFEERDLSVWAQDRLGGMISLVEAEEVAGADSNLRRRPRGARCAPVERSEAPHWSRDLPVTTGCHPCFGRRG